MAELGNGLRAGDIWVEGGRRYRSIDDDLVPLGRAAAPRLAGSDARPTARSRSSTAATAASTGAVRNRAAGRRRAPWPTPPRQGRLVVTPFQAGRRAGGGLGAPDDCSRAAPGADHRAARGGRRLDRLQPALHPPEDRAAPPTRAAADGRAGGRHQPRPRRMAEACRGAPSGSSPGSSTGTSARNVRRWRPRAWSRRSAAPLAPAGATARDSSSDGPVLPGRRLRRGRGQSPPGYGRSRVSASTATSPTSSAPSTPRSSPPGARGAARARRSPAAPDLACGSRSTHRHGRLHRHVFGLARSWVSASPRGFRDLPESGCWCLGDRDRWPALAPLIARKAGPS